MVNTDFIYVWKTFIIRSRSFPTGFVIVSYYRKTRKMCCEKNQTRIWYNEDVFNYFLKYYFRKITLTYMIEFGRK